MEKSIVKSICDELEKKYPYAECELNYGSAFELLVAVILSAQCTDKRVNEVTETLFKRCNTPREFVEIPTQELEKLIFSCGFYRNKARNIKNMSLDLLTRFGGEVPSDFDDLITLAGVGRKTANVVSAVAFGGDGMAVDTHVFRVSHRLGFSDGKTPFDVEKDLYKVIPEGERARVHHLLIFHGRYCCYARNPDCGRCTVREYCEYFGQTESKSKEVKSDV